MVLRGSGDALGESRGSVCGLPGSVLGVFQVDLGGSEGAGGHTENMKLPSWDTRPNR